LNFALGKMDSLNKCKWQDRNDQAVDIRICEYGRVDDGVGEGFGRADPAEESIGIIMSTHTAFCKNTGHGARRVNRPTEHTPQMNSS